MIFSMCPQLSSRTREARVGTYSRANYKTDDGRSRHSLRSCGMTKWSIPGVFIHQIPERLPHHVPPPIIEEQVQGARPEPTWRHRRDVWGEHNRPKLPQGAGRRQWFLAEHVEHRTTQPP